MKESNYITFLTLRLFMALLPLILGWPLLAFCLCVYNLVMITSTRGGVYGGIVSAATAFAGAMLCYVCGLGMAYGGFFALQIVLASSFCSLTVITRKGFAAGLLAASVGYGLGNVLNLKHLADSAGLSIADYMYSAVEPIVSQSINSAFGGNTPFPDGIPGFDADNMITLISDAIKSLIPGVIIIGAIIAGYGAMWMISRNLRGTHLDNRHSFSNIRINPASLCFGAAMLILLFVPGNMVNIVGLNGLIVFLFLAFCGGLSLADFLLRQKIERPLPRILIHIAIIIGGSVVSAFFPLVNIYLLYALMGIIDAFVSIRKRVTQQ